VLYNLLLCFVVALKTHLGNGFFALTQVLVLEYFCKKSIGIAIANTFFTQLFVLVLAILLGSIVNKPVVCMCI